MRKILVFVFALVMCLAMAACQTQQTPAPSTQPQTGAAGAEPAASAQPAASKGETYVLSLGGTTGTFYQLGAAVADYINTNFGDVMQLLPSTSAGGVENVRNISGGNAAFGPAFPKDVINAYTGVGYDAPMSNLRYVGIAQKPNACAIIVLADSGINSVYDLAGKTVAPGAPGSSAYDMFTEFAQHIGILDQMNIVNYGSEEIPGKMVDGDVDCCVVMTMAETAASRISSISSLKPIRILDVAEALNETKFLETASYYSTVVLPGGQYEGQDTEATCFSAYPVWVTSADVPEEIVYQFLKLAYSDEGVAYIGGIIAGQGHDTENQLETVFPVPLHDGALRYWQENGYAESMPSPYAK